MNIEKIIEQINMIKILTDNENTQKSLMKKYSDDFNAKYTIKENETFNTKNSINEENKKEDTDFKIKKIPRNEYEEGLYKSCNDCIYYKNYESYTLEGMKYCEKNEDYNKFLNNGTQFSIYDSPYKIVTIYECKNYKNSFDVQIEKTDKLINEIDELLKIEIKL